VIRVRRTGPSPPTARSSTFSPRAFIRVHPT
jgi:hypothetical protein